MCLLLISNNAHKKYKVILAANRDEFYNRPALPAHFWNDNPQLLAGKDLQAGGTWLGITKSGRIAAITNYRDLKNIKQDAPSRGNLITGFLNGNDSPEEYYNRIKKDAHLYNGFNLIFGVMDELFYFSNQSNEFKKLDAGIYGLSNCLLDTPWPKVEKTKRIFTELINKDDFPIAPAFEMLSDTQTAEDKLLPDTGVGLELERMLSSVFIKSDRYGTRCSTVILVDKDNHVLFTEKTYHPDKNKSTDVNFEFEIP